jgi:outer membrane usher protein
MKYVQYLPGAVLLLPSALAANPAMQQATATGLVEPVIEQSSPAGAPTRLLVPVVRSGRVFGDVLADLYADGQIRYERVTLIARLSPLLSEEGQQTFAAALSDAPMLSTEDIVRAGITLRYDPALLEIYVDAIDPQIAALQSLGTALTDQSLPITLEPSRSSAYLNVIGDFRVDEVNEFQAPGVLLTGAVRHRGVVLEFDGGIDREIAPDGGFYRRFARLVYDQPQQNRRWTAGDVQVTTLGLLGGVFVGGVGVEKGRRVFNDFGPLTSLGGQEILLDRDATVEVLVAGQQVETLQLRAGPYDLSRLRSEYSGRNAQLFITDVTGRRQLEDFDTFLDPGSLAPGETEYSAALGFVPDGFGNQPTYTSSPAFSGFYRRGINNRLTLGGALQISDGAQVAGAEVISSPVWLPGRFDLGLAVSSGQGFGMAGRVGYSLRFGDPDVGRQFSVNAEYQNAQFATIIDRINIGRAETFSLTANYSQRLSERTAMVVGASWFEREGFRANRSIFADVVHYTRNYRITAGAEYGQDFFNRSFGVRVAISIPLGRSTRADVSYNSRRDDFRAIASRSFEDRAGSWGYDVGLRRSEGTLSVDASGTYVGNRLFARGFATSSGRGLGNITDNPNARVQIGTALAFADGAFGIGRPIVDSFVVAKPHEELEDRQVLLGSSVQVGRPEAMSGTLGAALSGRLSSYNRQNIVYDLGGDGGVDIGSGIETVEPPYRSGYRLTVGTGLTVTAFGFLNLPTGRAGLVAGSVTAIDDAEFESQPFFTNSVGRFAIIGLRPGYTYELRLADSVAAYRIEVPADSDTLLQLDEITIVPAGGEQE